MSKEYIDYFNKNVIIASDHLTFNLNEVDSLSYSSKIHTEFFPKDEEDDV